MDSIDRILWVVLSKPSHPIIKGVCLCGRGEQCSVCTKRPALKPSKGLCLCGRGERCAVCG